jgi:hypothetical protein
VKCHSVHHLCRGFQSDICGRAANSAASETSSAKELILKQLLHRKSTMRPATRRPRRGLARCQDLRVRRWKPSFWYMYKGWKRSLCGRFKDLHNSCSCYRWCSSSRKTSLHVEKLGYVRCSKWADPQPNTRYQASFGATSADLRAKKGLKHKHVFCVCVSRSVVAEEN